MQNAQNLTIGLPVYIVNAGNNAARGIRRMDGTVHSGGNDETIAYIIVDTNDSDWFVNTARIEVPMSAVVRRHHSWSFEDIPYVTESLERIDEDSLPDTGWAIGIIPVDRLPSGVADRYPKAIKATLASIEAQTVPRQPINQPINMERKQATSDEHHVTTGYKGSIVFQDPILCRREYHALLRVSREKSYPYRAVLEWEGHYVGETEKGQPIYELPNGTRIYLAYTPGTPRDVSCIRVYYVQGVAGPE